VVAGMTQLVRYDEARRALAEAHTVDEVREIRDQAEALRAYARQAGDVEMLNWVSEIKLRAERRAGEMLKELSLNGGDRKSELHRERVKLDDFGIDATDSHRWQKVAAVPEPEFEGYIRETVDAGRELTSAGVRKLAKQSEPRERAYDVSREYCTTDDLEALANAVEGGDQPGFGTIYADPPWIYGNQSTRGATGDHYVGLSVDEICALPVAKLTAADSHLHLWTTNAFLFDSKRVMEAWGFTYKSCYVWVKPQIGMGNYWRVSHEFLLMGVRGTLTFEDHSLRSWGEFKRSQHSAKPERIRDLIHKASPGPRLELFARRAVEGWTCWGNEIRREVFAA
jgi:N6-adenosine-specific RNA methylase IME4